MLYCFLTVMRVNFYAIDKKTIEKVDLIFVLHFICEACLTLISIFNWATVEATDLHFQHFVSLL